MRNIARNNCQKIKGCPASQYLSCEAFKRGLECWQVDEPRCAVELRFCMQYGCPVYDRYSQEIEHALKDRALERR
ncbi:MAG: hypothetical protein A2W01_05860 [Candidatus Solincola sediminis]|uniref:Uncharacterized protein n=1 Tax=Candidatus Solincola sediminis TaxID=1797199 RepID=A0A1F2WGH9_9ACTN|nr:MAG: hypothetical protein A2Y75_04395 [Candidatus Solincola sediminis]OFW56250.1 MAG: hypothetical protein A2W01_05860 [Candidatus Solincola sediminis]